MTDAGGGIVAATMRTPPFNQVLSLTHDLEAVDLIVDAVSDASLPGVLGPTEAAARFANLWTDRTGSAARLATRERIFRLERLIPPARPAAGRWRLATSADRDLVAEWIVAFAVEVRDAPAMDALQAADRWVRADHRWLYLWESEERVVSLVGASGETPNGIRIGPVYTPPAERGRGYASSLTAAATADQLGRGRRFVFLFTDLANPTSNRIYRSLGYQPVCDVDEYLFEADA